MNDPKPNPTTEEQKATMAAEEKANASQEASRAKTAQEKQSAEDSNR